MYAKEVFDPSVEMYAYQVQKASENILRYFDTCRMWHSI